MSGMTSEELDALPVVFGFETACRALTVGRNQGYRLQKQGRFPVRVINICGRLKVTKHDLLAYLGGDGTAMMTGGGSMMPEARATGPPGPAAAAAEPATRQEANS